MFPQGHKGLIISDPYNGRYFRGKTAEPRISPVLCCPCLSCSRFIKPDIYLYGIRGSTSFNYLAHKGRHYICHIRRNNLYRTVHLPGCNNFSHFLFDIDQFPPIPVNDISDRNGNNVFTLVRVYCIGITHLKGREFCRAQSERRIGMKIGWRHFHHSRSIVNDFFRSNEIINTHRDYVYRLGKGPADANHA